METTYIRPQVEMAEIEIEKGFADTPPPIGDGGTAF